MNGRAYDYNLGRFLSVDPFIQSPGNSQSMNPYSYIMNNPLAGTDPSGYMADCTVDGDICDIGEIETKDIESIQITEDGNAVVNTTDGNSYQVETVNGKDVQGNLQGAHRVLEAVEQIGNAIRNMPAANKNFDPNRSEFREDSDDPRNEFGSNEYKSSGWINENDDYEQRTYGGTYTWQPVPNDSSGNSYTRHKSTKWVLIRAPSEGELESAADDNLLFRVLSNISRRFFVTMVLDAGVSAHDLLKDQYVWSREHRQEELMMEYRNDATRLDSGNVNTGQLNHRILNYNNLKATGRVRWSVIPGTEREELRTFPKDYNPNYLLGVEPK